MFDDIIFYVRYILYYQEGGKVVDIFIVIFDVRFVREREIVSNGGQEYFYIDQEIL